MITNVLYKTLDDFIKYLYDKRTGSSDTSDAYYRDIARFIAFMEDNGIKSFDDVDKNNCFEDKEIFDINKNLNINHFQKIAKELDEAEEYKKQQQDLFKKAEHELSEAKRMGRDVAEREKKLKEMKQALAQANENLEEKQIEFENSEFKIRSDIEKAELELKKEKVVSRKETTIAKEATKAANALANAAKTKQKTTKTVIVTFLSIAFLAVFAIIGFSIYSSNQRAAQLEYDRWNGNVCIPDEEVAKYEGAKSVCVEYYVGYVGKSDKLVFLNDKYNKDARNFTGVVKSIKKLPYDDAKAKYLNKNIKLTGDIIKYNDSYQIEIYDESQIEIEEK